MQLEAFRHFVEQVEDLVQFTPESPGHPVWEFGAMLVSLDAGLKGLHREDANAWEWARNLHYATHGNRRIRK